MNPLTDAATVSAEAAEQAADEARAAAWAGGGDDRRPTRVEADRAESGPCRECYPPVPWAEPVDPWDDGPVHHPTRFDLPVSAEPPF
jgi:hypothetical protein